MSYKVVQALILVVGYIPPKFNSVVKAIENKGRNYTKIGNLDII